MGHQPSAGAGRGWGVFFCCNFPFSPGFLLSTMKTLLLLLTLGAASAVTLSAKIVRTVDRTFAVEPGGTLAVATEGGDITIETAAISEVRITARQTIRASSEAEADRLLEKLTLTLDQSGQQVTAEAKYERGSGWFRGSLPVQVDFIVTVPERFDVGLRTSGGNLRVGNLTGQVTARTSGGNITLQRIDGPVEANTSGGNISLREGTGRAKLHTSGGNIRVDQAAGPVEATTSGGDLVLSSVKNLVLAKTSGGDVTAVITTPPTGDTTLSTSGGNVSVRLPADAKFRLDASTSGGSVTATGLTITLDGGGVGKSRLSGDVNGGGPVLKLRTSGGNIRVRSE